MCIGRDFLLPNKKIEKQTSGPTAEEITDYEMTIEVNQTDYSFAK